MVAAGAWSPPIASRAMRGISGSGFPRGDGLPARVVAALLAHAVRPARRAALRARLQDDRRRLLVRVARALLALRGPSLRYGHGFSLVGPPRTGARALVQVGTAGGAQPPAIGT